MVELLDKTMDKFQNKYRIATARLQNWDYGINAAYFITICTKDKTHFLGQMANNEMQLTEIGKLTEKYWVEIINHFAFVELGNFVVMPNHVHGILIINKPSEDVETRHCLVSANTNTATDVQAGGDKAVPCLHDADTDTNTKTGVQAGGDKALPCLHDADTDTNTETKNLDEKTIGQKRFQNQGKNTISSIVGAYKSAVTKNARFY